MGQYFKKCFGGDIALLELEDKIDERYSNYACLPHMKELPTATSGAVTTGWTADRQSFLFNKIRLSRQTN